MTRSDGRGVSTFSDALYQGDDASIELIETALAFIIAHIVSGSCHDKDQHKTQIAQLKRTLERKQQLLTNSETQL